MVNESFMNDGGGMEMDMNMDGSFADEADRALTPASSVKKGHRVSFAEGTKEGDEGSDEEEEEEENGKDNEGQDEEKGDGDDEEEGKKKKNKKRREALRAKRKRRQSALAAERLGKNLLFLDQIDGAQNGGLRRSKRQRMAPLKFWKGESVEYQRGTDGVGELIPTISKTVRLGAPTPVLKKKKKKKTTKNNNKNENSDGKKKKKEKPIRLPRNFVETKSPVAAVKRKGENGEEDEDEEGEVVRFTLCLCLFAL